MFYLLASCVLLCSTTSFANLLNINPESVEAEAWTILDSQSGQVIAEHNSHVQRAPASLTKMMVAYIALKDIQSGKLQRHELLTVSPVVNQVMSDESQMRLKVGEQVSIDTLLAGLVVMSANDAALLLAERISGNVANFLQRMNAEAKALGMHNSHFSNPPGITMPDHYSTAADFALLGQALVNETPSYLYYSKLPDFRYQGLYHAATNVLLKTDPTVDGLKTGFTKAAGYNLALTAQRNTARLDAPQRRLIVVVLGTTSIQKRAEVAHKLMNLAYTYTQNERIVQKGQHLANLPVSQSKYTWFEVKALQSEVVTTSLYALDTPIDLKAYQSDQARLKVLNDQGQMTLLEPLTNTQTRLEASLIPQTLAAPLNQSMPLLDIKVYQNKQLLRHIQVENHVQLEQHNVFQQFMAWCHDLWHGIQRKANIKL
ncbi:D-alanyl-D-alanine carboxypeptidase family protein [uncultured Acinetobacter sp.]|uniref:D-alanyl-D-alanine carboxypeptidase family protein n=1 Tax=uncultured Acinetobacter sp. TaxID=165433 RepID=UPI00260BAB18|nr:D-alanyl-D-alanine carboxypeptidase family protein [uncultured Acinetobacter sp.]